VLLRIAMGLISRSRSAQQPADAFGPFHRVAESGHNGVPMGPLNGARA